ncbi:MAG TPA: hypothetical protein VF748_11705, partial [Candidatus Acidoferrum sp.]
NFRARLGTPEVSDEGELSNEALGIIAQLKQSYGRLTDGVARNRTLPQRAGFTGDELIADYAELVLVDQYVRLERNEAVNFRQLEEVLELIPIYTDYLEQQRGIGPAMAGVLVSYFDPAKARHVSSFWKYAGLDVGPDGQGRSRRAEHLVERAYTDKNGDEKTRQGITYEPFLKTKLMGVLAGSFLRSTSPWRKVYDDYKHRLETDAARTKVTVNEWKKRHRAGEDTKHLWTPGRIHTASSRYMIKMFLAEFWAKWRELEGLPVSEPYSVDKQGNRPHAA